MTRIMLSGPELEGFVVDEPAASVRLLLPPLGSAELVIPKWNGNEFLMADGSRPVIRTFTPQWSEPDSLALDLVIHEGGAASAWVVGAKPGDPVAISGPGRGYVIDPHAAAFVLAGDETATPAIGQLLDHLPAGVPVEVHIEVVDPAARPPLPTHSLAKVHWHSASRRVGDELVRAIAGAEIDAGTIVWCAGEASAMHRIRTELFKNRGLPRSQATVRGYWKLPRAEQS